MDLDLFFAKCLRRLHGDKSRAQLEREIRYLERVNQHGTKSLLDPDGPVVSLTSYGKRVATAHLTIESIGRGWQRPSRLILWIDEANLLANIPQSLMRQRERGLEILACENFGPHKKYYPYVQSVAVHGFPLVTADDDALYPSYWLWRLQRANRATPDTVACFRAHTIQFSQDGRLLPYAEWTRCESRVTSPRIFPTGVGGVIYPPALLEKLRNGERDFMAKSPKADDVWLHSVAIRNHFFARQIIRLRREPALIPETQHSGLVHQNLYAHGNDAPIAACYSEADVKLILSASAG